MNNNTCSLTLLSARRAEAEGMERISPEERPAFHLTPPAGWLNDPNGFSFYGGKYHLFFQYNPYAAHWDKMHWGHAVTSDLLRWTYLPAVLAPDSVLDEGGCFSGSAIELGDGRQLLMYTGLTPAPENWGSPEADVCDPDAKKAPEYYQVQNLAVGDGRDYVKYEGNPVIGSGMLPEGLDLCQFRDPKMIPLKDGSYGVLTVSMGESGLGHVLLFRSEDGFSWQFVRELYRNDGRFGLMWECPDFFELDGKWFLLVSPMDMIRRGFEYHNGYESMVFGGSFDEESLEFKPDYDQCVDYGIDFYAAQTMLAPDGRRIMVGWMQNWETREMIPGDMKWAGQMTVPRELSFRDGRLYQQPVREISRYYGNTVFYRKVPVSDEINLYGVDGRVIDLDIKISPAQDEPLYRYFVIRFAMNEEYYSEAMYSPDTGIFVISREYSGTRKGVLHQRNCLVPESMDGNLSVRILLDRYSFEIFINDGRYAMSAVIYTDPGAAQISFRAGGKAVIDVAKREIKL